MKTLIASTALALAALTGAAHAAGTVSAVERAEIERAAPFVDADTLSFAQAQTALNIIHSSDNLGEVQTKLRSILR
ncbi:hypothetical protein JYP51_13090 [Ponticoccus gilvus]|nr:hypothetical protein [Enemella evansiae]